MNTKVRVESQQKLTYENQELKTSFTRNIFIGGKNNDKSYHKKRPDFMS